MTDQSIKQKIINSFEILVSSQGLEHTSVSQVAKHAGIAKGSVYTYFTSKEDIYIASMERFAEKRIKRLKELLGAVDSSEKQLEILAKANMKMFRAKPETFIFNYASIMSTHDELKKRGVQDYLNKYIDFIAEIIHTGINKKEFVKCDANSIAFLFVVGLDLGLIFHEQGQKDPSPSGIYKGIVNLIKFHEVKRDE